MGGGFFDPYILEALWSKQMEVKFGLGWEWPILAEASCWPLSDQL